MLLVLSTVIHPWRPGRNFCVPHIPGFQNNLYKFIWLFWMKGGRGGNNDNNNRLSMLSQHDRKEHSLQWILPLNNNRFVKVIRMPELYCKERKSHIYKQFASNNFMFVHIKQVRRCQFFFNFQICLFILTWN